MRKGSIQHYAVVILQHTAHPSGEPMPRSASQASSAGETTQTPAVQKPKASGIQVPELPSRPPRRRATRAITTGADSAKPARSPARSKAKAAGQNSSQNSNARRPRRSQEHSDVLVSAVISTYLLTHLHHVLQRAEYSAVQEGRRSQAANYAQLRKVLCMDARSMEDASATGLRDADLDLAA